MIKANCEPCAVAGELFVTRGYLQSNEACSEHGYPMRIQVPYTYPDETTNLQELIVDGQTLKTGEKKDEGKPRMELVPYDAVRGVADILTIGASKYSARNWELGIAYGRIFGAVQRHLTSWWQGENTDIESGKSHLDHALCELMFLSAYEKRRMVQFDDRPGSIKQDSRPVQQDIRQG